MIIITGKDLKNSYIYYRNRYHEAKTRTDAAAQSDRAYYLGAIDALEAICLDHRINPNTGRRISKEKAIAILGEVGRV